MPSKDRVRTPEPESVAEAVQALSEIAKQLSEVSSTLLAACREGQGPPAEALSASQEALAHLSQRLDDWEAQGKAKAAAESQRTARLRKEILGSLLRRGPAFPVELAAATLSVPEEVRSVLDEMDREGLIEIREVKGGQLVALTAKGRQEACR
jgi:hypothetical protein